MGGDSLPRSAATPALRRLGALAGALAGLALVSPAGAQADQPGAGRVQVPAKPDVTWSMSAADTAGWLVFPSHRGGEAEDYTPSTIRLKSVTDPGAPRTPGMDWLDRWGLVQSNVSR